MFEGEERQYIESTRIGRLATADADGLPHVIPVCFVLVDDDVLTPIDEKPQDVAPDALRRTRDIRANPHVALVADHYTEKWSRLGWVQIWGTATLLAPGNATHSSAVTALREKYAQYAEHSLEDRPMIQISPGSIHSWGHLERPTEPNC